MDREKLHLTKKEAREIIYSWGEKIGYENINDEQVDSTRWSIVHRIIIRRLSDGKYFADHYSVGATEMQEEQPYENDEPDFTEVFKKYKVIKVYE
jgi:hypothetical protein